MRYYLRATGENKYAVGTSKWMEILSLHRVSGEYFELEVDAPAGSNRFVCIDRDLPCPNLDFAKDFVGFGIISHTQFLSECAGERLDDPH